MMFDHIPSGPSVPDVLHAIVEIPQGSRNKYELDKDYGVIRLDRVLFSPMFYPGEYGYVPQTLALDGDPLDVIILVSAPTMPGTLIEVRPIGVLNMIDQGEPDDKILCVPTSDPRFAHISDLADVPPHTLKEIAHFFAAYKTLENKKVEVGDWKDAAAAKAIIVECVDRKKKEQ